MEVVRVIKDHKKIKKPKLLPDNTPEIFAPKKLHFKPAEYHKNDSRVIIDLPEKVKGYYYWSLDCNITDLNTGENCEFWIFKSNFYPILYLRKRQHVWFCSIIFRL